jgi:type I restriction-modification system DNA methylase subunit
MVPNKPLFHRGVLQQEVARHVAAGRVPTPEQHDVLRRWRDALRTTRYTEANLEQSFLGVIFGGILGYRAFGEGPAHNIVPKRSASGRDFPDFLLGTFSPAQNINRCRAVGELKGIDVNLDLAQTSRQLRETPVQQAFRCALHQPGTEWILVSNFTEIRLYRNGYIDSHHSWTLDELADNDERFNEFYVLLCQQSIAPDDSTAVPDSVRLLDSSQHAGLRLTEGFYGLYDSARQILVRQLATTYPQAPLGVLYGKTHKLLNRVLFAAFCEDHPARLLPADTLQSLHEAAKARGGHGAYWSVFANFFRELDKGSTPGAAVAYHAFNGGLFAHDDFIDTLDLPDELFTQAVLYQRNRVKSREIQGVFGFYVYDFADELDVDSLGSIFEQSLKDLPHTSAAVRGRGQAALTRRETSGVYYTPQALTHLMASRALKAAIEPIAEPLEAIAADRKIGRLVKAQARRGKKPMTSEEIRDLYFWDGMLDAMQGLTVIDPACGSGAFLVAAFRQFYDEYHAINSRREQLREAIPFSGLDKLILRNNLHGVDLLHESVELTKLSIWLRTASATEPLEKLDATIWSQDSLREFEGGKPTTFDIVLSNPPWGAELPGWDAESLVVRFPNCGEEKDSYAIFTIRGYELLKFGGILAYVMPNSWLTTAGYEPFRRWLLDSFDILEIVNVWKVFEDVNHDCCLLIARKRDPNSATTAPPVRVRGIKRGLSAERTKWQHIAEERWATDFEADAETWKAEPAARFETIYPPALARALSQCSSRCRPLGDVCDITVGIQVYHRDKVDAQTIAQRAFHSDSRRGSDWYPQVTGNDVQRYYGLWPTNQFLLYSDRLCDKRELAHYEEPRVLVQQIMWQRLRACVQLPTEPYLYLNTLFSCTNPRHDFDLNSIAALLNSRFVAAAYERWSNRLFGDKFPKLSKLDLARLPVPKLPRAKAKALSVAGLALSADWTELRNVVREHREFVTVKVGEKSVLAAGAFWTLDRETALHAVTGRALEREDVSRVMHSWEDIVRTMDGIWRRILAREDQVDGLLATAYALPAKHYDELIRRVAPVALEDVLLPR